MSTQKTASPAAAPKRGRGPSTAKTATTKAALLRAALAEFVERGFAAATMSNIAERAGFAKGTTYLHFRSKEVLFAEMLRSIVAAPATRSIKRPRPGESIRDFLLRTVPPRLREMQGNGNFRILPLIASEGQRMPEIAAIYKEVAIAPVQRLIGIYMRRAERNGELPPASLSASPILLAAPAVTGILWNALFAGTEQVDIGQLFAQFLQLVFPARESDARPSRSRSHRE